VACRFDGLVWMDGWLLDTTDFLSGEYVGGERDSWWMGDNRGAGRCVMAVVMLPFCEHLIADLVRYDSIHR
jgi:hypothetical protein